MNTENELKKDEKIINNFAEYLKLKKEESDKDLKLFLINLNFETDLIMAANLIIKELTLLNIDWLDYMFKKMRKNVLEKQRYGWEHANVIIFVNMFKNHLFKYLETEKPIDLIDLLILIMFILYLEKRF